VSGVREGRRTGSARIKGGGTLGQLRHLHFYFTFLFHPMYLRLLHISCVGWCCALVAYSQRLHTPHDTNPTPIPVHSVRECLVAIWLTGSCTAHLSEVFLRHLKALQDGCQHLPAGHLEPHVTGAQAHTAEEGGHSRQQLSLGLNTW